MKYLFDYLTAHFEAALSVWPIIIVFIIVGVALLKYGADWLVNGAANMGIRFGMSSIMVGLTIIAFGTSAPELVVSVLTAAKKQPEICLGNVIGSNIANVGLVLGITVLIMPIAIRKTTAYFDGPMSFATIFAVFIMAIIPIAHPELSRVDGIILLTVFVLWMGVLIYNARRKTPAGSSGDALAELPNIVLVQDDDVAFHDRNVFIDIALVLVGLVGLMSGADALVAGSVEAAGRMGISNTVIGLTVVAIGTSLPELAVCVVAAMKGQAGITIGNVLGSNIFNALLILGTATTISPIRFNTTSRSASGDWGTVFIDIPFCVMMTLILIPMMIHKKELHRWKGFVLLSAYVFYIAWLVVRNTWPG